jgi:hypothetical protein
MLTADEAVSEPYVIKVSSLYTGCGRKILIPFLQQESVFPDLQAVFVSPNAFSRSNFLKDILIAGSDLRCRRIGVLLR